MEAVTGTISSHDLRIKCVIDTSLYGSLYNPLLSLCNSYLKQLYISNKMEHFVIKVGVAYMYQGLQGINKKSWPGL